MDGLTGAYFASMAAGGGFYLVSLAAGHHVRHHGARPGSHLPRVGRAGGWALGALVDLAAVSAVAAVGGGAGYLARLDGLAAVPSLAVALPCGLLAGLAVHGLAIWLDGQTRYRQPAELPGTLAHVLVRAQTGRIGEVWYEQDGLRRTMPASNGSNEALEEGDEVVIVNVENGIALVTPTRAFLMEGKK